MFILIEMSLHEENEKDFFYQLTKLLKKKIGKTTFDIQSMRSVSIISLNFFWSNVLNILYLS